MSAFGTAVACAVDVSIENKRPKIHRATVALDCGLAVNPLTIESQFQGGLGFGVTQLMAQGAITFKDGHVEQRNFDGYTPPTLSMHRSRSTCILFPAANRPPAAVSLPFL